MNWGRETFYLTKRREIRKSKNQRKIFWEAGVKYLDSVTFLMDSLMFLKIFSYNQKNILNSRSIAMDVN